MKVLYISSPHFFDLDLSFVKALSQKCELFYLLDVAPNSRNYTALDLGSYNIKSGIYPISHFPEMNKWDRHLNSSRCFILYRTSNKSYHLSNIKLQGILRSFVKKIAPDVIHTSGFLNIRHLFFLALNKQKIILTVHDAFPHSGEDSAQVRRKRAFNYLFIKNILLLNRTQRNLFIKSGHANKKVFVSSLGVYEYLTAYKKQVKPDGVFRILFFGRISRYKGLEYLLQAFQMFIDSGSVNVELIIAGSGKFWFDITQYQQIKQLKIINRFIPNSELVELLQMSSVVVCPYIDATQSGVIMTSYALHKSVVATNVGGLPEMVEHNKTGLIVPERDSAALFNVFKILEADRDKLYQFEQNILETYFTGERSWDSITEKIIIIYGAAV